MNPPDRELQRTNTQLNDLSQWMEPSSRCHDSTQRDHITSILDNKISAVVQSDWGLWEIFKKDISHSILIDRVIQNLTSRSEITEEDKAAFNKLLESEGGPLQESLIKLKGIWDGFQATQQVDLAEIEELKKQVKDAMALEARAIQEEIALCMTVAPKAQATTEEGSLATLAEDEARRIASNLSLLSITRPNLSRALNSLTKSIIDGKYGPKVTEAFKEDSEEVLAISSFLKIVLMEDAEQIGIPHTVRQLELAMPTETRAKIFALRADLKAVAEASIPGAIASEIPTLESLLGLEGSAPLSETGNRILSQLNTIVGLIKMKKEDEKAYISLVCNTPNEITHSSNLYQEAFDKRENLTDPYDRAELLVSTILKLKSSSPEMFFKATNLALGDLEQIALQGFIMVEDFRSQLLDCLLKELATPQKISEAFLQMPADELTSSPLWKFIKDRGLKELRLRETPGRSSLLSQTIVCKQLESEPLEQETLNTIKNLIADAKSSSRAALSVVLFQTLLRCQDERVKDLLPQVAGLVSLLDRFQCFTQLAHIANDNSDADSANQLALQALESAKKTMQEEIFLYLRYKTPETEHLIKDDFDRLCEYLNEELTAFLPSVNMKLDLITKLIEEEIDPVKKMRLTTLFIPQLLSMDKKSVAMSFAREALNEIAPEDLSLEALNEIAPEDLSLEIKKPLLTNLFNALSGAISTSTMIAEPSSEEIEFKQSYLEAIGQVTPLSLSIEILTEQAAKLQPIDPEFSIAVATKALEKIKEYPPGENPFSNKEQQNMLSSLIDKLKNTPSIVSQAQVDLKTRLDLEKNNLYLFTSLQNKIDARIALMSGYMKAGQQKDAFTVAQEALQLLRQNPTEAEYSIVSILQTALLKVIKDFKVTSPQDSAALKKMVFDLFIITIDDADPEKPFQTLMSFLKSLKKSSFEPDLYEELASQLVPTILTEIENIEIEKTEGLLPQEEGEEEVDTISTKRLQIDCLETLRKELKKHLPSALPQVDTALQQAEADFQTDLLENLGDLEREDRIEFLAFLIPKLIAKNQLSEASILAHQAVDLLNPEDRIEEYGLIASIQNALVDAIKQIHEIGTPEAHQIKSDLIPLFLKTIEAMSLDPQDCITRLIRWPGLLEKKSRPYTDRLLRDVSAKIAKEILQQIQDISLDNNRIDKQVKRKKLTEFCNEFSKRARIIVKEAKEYLKTVNTELFNIDQGLLESEADLTAKKKEELLFERTSLSLDLEQAPEQTLAFARALIPLLSSLEGPENRARLYKGLFEIFQDFPAVQGLLTELVEAVPEEARAFSAMDPHSRVGIEMRSEATAALLEEIKRSADLLEQKEQLKDLLELVLRQDYVRLYQKLYGTFSYYPAFQSLLIDLVQTIPEEDQAAAFKSIVSSENISTAVKLLALKKLIEEIKTIEDVGEQKRQLKELLNPGLADPLKISIQKALKELKKPIDLS